MNESNIITNELPLQLNTINQSSKKNVTKECKLKGHSQTMFTRVGDQKSQNLVNVVCECPPSQRELQDS